MAFFFAWLIPWALGTAVSLACLKRRYGYLSLAVGSGYLLGLLISLLAQKYLADTQLTVILTIEAVLGLLIAVFFKAKRCTIEEQRLEKAPSNSTYFICWLLIILLSIKLIFMLTEITSLGNIYSLFLSVSNGPTEHLIWQKSTWGIPFLSDATLINQYSTALLNQSQHSLAYLPWVGVHIALGFIVFGGLRYLRCRLLPALLTCYMVLSLPFVFSTTALSYSTYLAVATYFIWVTILLAILIGFIEYRLLLLIAFGFSVLSAYPFFSLLVILMGIVFILSYFLKLKVTAILLCLLPIVGYLLVSLSLKFSFPPLQIKLLSSITHDIILQNEQWHFALLVVFISLIYFLSNSHRHDHHALGLLLLGAIMVFVIAISLLVIDYNKNLDSIKNNIISIRYITPLLCMIPVCVYQLTTFDNESLPVI